MKPRIDQTEFGTITNEGTPFENDEIIRLQCKVKKRKKELSKAIYGTSHVVSLDEAKHVYQKGAERLVVGAGQEGMLKLSDEAAGYFEDRGCRVDVLPTGQAIHAWNEADGAVIGLFHITC